MNRTAKAAAADLRGNGIDCLTLRCAFRAAGAKEIIEGAGNKILIGYITHLPEQDDVHQPFFAD